LNSLRVTFIAFLGSILWAIHFMSIYAFAEFGCKSEWSWTSLMIIGITIIALSIGLFSIFESYKMSKLINKETHPSLFFLTTYGIISNAVFTFIMAYQSVPIFYFRGECL
jgi:hypothetical protein